MSSKISREKWLFILSAVLFSGLCFVPMAYAFSVANKVASDAAHFGAFPYLAAILFGVFAVGFILLQFLLWFRARSGYFRVQCLSICITTGVLLLFGVLIRFALPAAITAYSHTVIDPYPMMSEYAETASSYIAEEHRFIALNILNANYDPTLSYWGLRQKTEDGRYADDQLQACLSAVEGGESLSDDSERELYEYVFTYYILSDKEFAYAVTPERRAERERFCMALTKRLAPLYKDLCRKGIAAWGLGGVSRTGDARMSWLFCHNYNDVVHNGFAAFEQNSALYLAVYDKQTLPVLLHLALDERYPERELTDRDRQIAALDQGLSTVLYMPEVLARYRASFPDEMTYAESFVDGRSARPYFDEDGVAYYVYSDGLIERSFAWSAVDVYGERVTLVTQSLTTLWDDSQQMDDFIQSLVDVAAQEIGLDETYALIRDTTQDTAFRFRAYVDDDMQVVVEVYPNAYQYGSLGFLHGTVVLYDNWLLLCCAAMPCYTVLLLMIPFLALSQYAFGYTFVRMRQSDGETADE